MKAVVYNGPKNVSVETVDDPKIEKPTDVIIRVTTTNICGSDLHMYDGRTSFEKGRKPDSSTPCQPVGKMSESMT